MTSDPAPSLAPAAAVPRLAEPVLIGLAYLGGLGLLAASTVRSVVRPGGPVPRLAPAVARQMDGLIRAGLPLVVLVHVPMGSFLAMQAYFHATFTAAVGAVVGLGLLRNLAPMLAGLTLAGLLAARIVPELRAPHDRLDADDPRSVPDRGATPDPASAPDPARLTAVRVLAATIIGPVLALAGWGAGTVVGMLVARSMLAVSPAIFVGKILSMIHPIDVAGLVVKGSAFGAASALIACHEGLRRPGGPAAPARAACLAIAVILLINSTWFTLVYLAGAPFGPAVGG